MFFQANLYPTVGLQTPGEVVEANFGQNPFVFDIEDYMREWRRKTRLTIERFPVQDKKGEWQTALQKYEIVFRFSVCWTTLKFFSKLFRYYGP